MRKIILIFVCLFMFVSCKSSNQKVVYVYNWGEYMDPQILKDFEAETGIKVIYDTFEQNEDLYMKVKRSSSSYDIIIPSDYMIEKMRDDGMLQKIDKNRLQNFSNIGDDFLNLDFDPNNDYSIPYLWGTVGILYNTKLVEEPVDSWNILWNKKYKDQIIMLNSTRDSIGIALKKNHFSMNSKDPKALEIARQDLMKQKDLVMAYLGDETKSQMVNNSAALAVMYSGEALGAMSENENLVYVIPKEGSNLWFDNMAIPKNAKNIDNAYIFIDYILRPEVGQQIAEYVEYSVPNEQAKELLDDAVKEDPVAYPDFSKLPKMEVFRDPKHLVDVYEDIWADLKAE